MQIRLCLSGRLNVLKLNHCLDDGTSLEHNNAQNLAEGGTDLVDDVDSIFNYINVTSAEC